MSESLLVNIDIYIRVAIFAAAIIGGIAGLSLWRNQRINHLSVSKYWRLFIIGVIFYAVAAFADIFTPITRATLGMLNLIIENLYLCGLGLIFVSLNRFISDYLNRTTIES